MKYKESLKIKGKIEIFEEDKKVYEKENLVVDTGTALICDRLKDNTVDFLDYIAVGTDSTAVNAGDVQLYAELDRKQATDKDAGTNTFIIETIFNPGEAIGTWREAGIFNASSSGIMFNRTVINYTKSTVNTTVKFTITFTAS